MDCKRYAHISWHVVGHFSQRISRMVSFAVAWGPQDVIDTAKKDTKLRLRGELEQEEKAFQTEQECFEKLEVSTEVLRFDLEKVTSEFEESKAWEQVQCKHSCIGGLGGGVWVVVVQFFWVLGGGGGMWRRISYSVFIVAMCDYVSSLLSTHILHDFLVELQAGKAVEWDRKSLDCTLEQSEENFEIEANALPATQGGCGSMGELWPG